MGTGQIAQLIAAALVAIVFFVLVYQMSERSVLLFLIVLIPIQLLDSRFGSLNVFLTYFVGFAFMLQRRLKVAPFLWAVFLLLFAYAVSFTMSHPDARIWHIFYMIGFVSNFLLFYLVYNYVVRTEDWKSIFVTLFWMNVLVVIACIIEIALGDNQIRLFGVNDWKLGGSRVDQGRLVGPFGSTHTTADYLVAQCMLIGYWLVHASPTKLRWLLLLLALNFSCLVATGDRGGFVGFLVGALMFLYLFRREIGGVRVIQYSVVGAVIFAVASLLIIEYTQFDRLFERIESTQLEGEERPRAEGFSRGVRWFQEDPIIGKGPKLNISSRANQIGEIEYRGAHPHNLVLTILVTTGIVGLAAWLIVFGAAVSRLLRGLRSEDPNDPLLSNIPKLSLLIIFLFLVGELRIEFLRDEYFDYQHYVFTSLALFIACSDLLVRRARSSRIRHRMSKGAAQKLPASMGAPAGSQPSAG